MTGLPLSQFYATFRPRRVDDLSGRAQEAIGCEGVWLRAWVIDDGPYAGEWACMLVDPFDAYFGWVPECDLQ